MNVACGACPAKYVIPDEKVRGRKVRIPCKHCGAAIIVDGTVAVPEAATAQIPVGGSPKASLASTQIEATKSTSTTTSGAPGVVQPSTNAALTPPKQAVRPQRAIRQTIIGVAAPANAPESAPTRAAPIRRPTPIYVRSPGLTAEGAAVSPAQPPIAAPNKMRSVRRTMLGGLDSEEPEPDSPATGPVTGPKSEGPPVTTPVPKPRSRDIKQTIIGGLEAAIGSAPGAEEPRKRPIPKQDTPAGTYMAILPDGKTLRITLSELPRALSKTYVSGDTPFWRTGMTDWVPLSQIPELSQFLTQNSARPQLKPPAAPVQPKSANRAPNTTALRTKPSQPAPVPSFSRPPTAARLPVPSGPTPKRVDSSARAGTPSFSAQLGTSPFTPSAAQISHGPASVSARSSSPTLELVELDNDDDVEALMAKPDDTISNPHGIRELQRLAASATSPLQEPGFSATSRISDFNAATKSGHSNSTRATGNMNEALAVSGTVDQVTQQQSALSPFEAKTAVGAAPAISRPKQSKTLRTAIVLILLLACSMISLITRQPRPVYNYLHARGWDQTIEVISKKVIEPALTQIRRLLRR